MPQKPQLPTEDDVFNQFAPQQTAQPQNQAQAPKPPAWWEPSPAMEKAFPGMSMAMRQIAEMPGAVGSMINSLPSSLYGLFTHPLTSMGEGINSSIVQPAETSARGLGALVGQLPMVSGGQPIAPNIQAPSQEDWQHGIQGATQLAASTAIPEAIKGAAGAGISRAAEAGPGAAGVFKNVAQNGVVRGLAKSGYEHFAKAPSQPIQAEFVNTPAAEPPPIDVESTPVSKPTPPPAPKQIGAASSAKALAPVPPDTQIFHGEDVTGQSTGEQPHPDIVGQRRLPVKAYKGDGTGATPGQYRLETVNEMKARLGNFGRTVSAQPGPDAQPYNPPKQPRAAKPTPPQAKGASK